MCPRTRWNKLPSSFAKTFDAIIPTPPDALTLKEYVISFRPKSEFARAREFSAKVRDVTDFSPRSASP